MRGFNTERNSASEPNLDDLLRPSDAFGHPNEVLCDPDLSINEKRAILASWASDICSVEAMPELRKIPVGNTVAFDDVMDALRKLDEQARKGLKRTPTEQRCIRQSDIL